MKLKVLCTAMLLAAGSIGIACASPDLVQNGNFSNVTGGIDAPTQFGSASYDGTTSHQFIVGWTGNNGYNIWFNDATDATTKNAVGQYSGSGKEMLWPTVGAPPLGGQTFVGMDGDQCLSGSPSHEPPCEDNTGSQVQGEVSQMIGGLTIGQNYAVTFSWGAGQLQSRHGATTQHLAVSFGETTINTDPVSNSSDSFAGWNDVTMTFTAGAASQLLSFLAVGTPGSLPPFAVLSGVSVRAVPEPPELALFGGGLLGLGLLTVLARRRALHAKATEAA